MNKSANITVGNSFENSGPAFSRDQSDIYQNTTYNDESLNEMRAQRLKLIKMQQLYNNTGDLVESLSLSTNELNDANKLPGHHHSQTALTAIVNFEAQNPQIGFV